MSSPSTSSDCWNGGRDGADVILDAIIAAIRHKTPDCGVRIETNPTANDQYSQAMIVIPARHPKVGDVVIWEDGEEATVFIGALTHHHVNPYDTGLTPEQRAAWIAADVAAFTSDLLSDRILIWRASGRGGWTKVDERPARAPATPAREWFVWSGPLPA